jgi:hypothetical protein
MNGNVELELKAKWKCRTLEDRIGMKAKWKCRTFEDRIGIVSGGFLM